MSTGSAFFGRRDDLDALEKLAAAGERLVTLTGPGGVGKTRLARRWCEEAWEGRSAFCDLSAARTLGEVAGAVARSLEVGASREGALLDRIGRALAARGRALLVLDNCEQAVEAVSRAVAAWREASGEAMFLVTSREPLRVFGERVHAVLPLGLPAPGGDPTRSDAVRMFVDRVERARPGAKLGPEELDLASSIVRRLDGLPLAIELAAARAGVLGLAAIFERLERRLDVLTGGPRDLAERQRTMRAAIGWSWELLAPWERAALAQCSVFRGGFSAEAAEAVVDLPEGAPPCLDVLQGLVEKSMLHAYEPGGGGDVRLGMYDAIREFCAAELEESGRAEETRARHAATYADASTRWAAQLATRKGKECVRALGLELENLAAAREQALEVGGDEGARDAAALALAMVPALAAQGSVDEQLRVLDGTLERVRAVGVVPLASLLAMRGEARATAGQLEGAREDAAASLAAARAAGDGAAETHALAVEALAAWHSGDWDGARAAFDAALSKARAAGDAAQEATVLRRLANLALDRRRLEEAREFAARAREVVVRTGNRREEAPVLGTLSLVLHLAGRLDEAAEMGQRALGVFGELGDGHGEAIAAGNLAVIHHQRGRLEDARGLFERAIRGARYSGDRRLLGTVTAWLARLDHEQGRLESAHEGYVDALDRLAEVDATRARAIFVAARAALEADRGYRELAASLLAEADRAAPPGDAHVAAAIAVYRAHVAGASPAAAGPADAESEDVALARRLRPRPAAAAPSARSLRVGPGGAWFRAPGADPVDLSRRRSLRHVLLALARQRLDAPGEPLRVEELVRRGWPGEKMSARSGAMRAYTSVTRLRKLGLSEVLLSRGAGYLLDPHVDVAVEA